MVAIQPSLTHWLKIILLLVNLLYQKYQEYVNMLFQTYILPMISTD